VFRVQADRFDDEIQLIGTVDLARYAVGHVGPDELGFGEVIEPVNPLVSRSCMRSTAYDGYSVREIRRR
jgi:hypothetical protein